MSGSHRICSLCCTTKRFLSCAQQDTPLSDRQRNQIYQLLGFKNDMKVRFVDFNEPTIALKLVESGAGLLPQACASRAVSER